MKGRIRGVVSGGQSGVDRAALDAALRQGLPVSGWCPAGRAAEDGRLPDRYPLRETPSSDPLQRTGWNVYDSDATLVLSPAPPGGGTATALSVAKRFDRPHLIVDPRDTAPERVLDWLSTLDGPVLLNVAGPRESEAPGIAAAAAPLLDTVLSKVADTRHAARGPSRVLVTGAAGFLGSEVVRLAPPGVEVTGTYRTLPAGSDGVRVELSNRDEVAALFESIQPDRVIHTAYSTAAPERDIDLATRHVADLAAEHGARLVHLSSDTVLDGENAPYDESAAPAPVSDYGRWKARAEASVSHFHPGAAIVRTSLITRFDPPDPRTAWVLSLLRGDAPATLFVDEIRCPIMVTDLARQLWEVARLGAAEGAGIWNLVGPEALSRYALGVVIGAAFGEDPGRLVAAESPRVEEPRPRDLRLSTARADRSLLTRAEAVSAAADRQLRRRTIARSR